MSKILITILLLLITINVNLAETQKEQVKQRFQNALILAKEGDAEAQFFVGYQYYSGEIVTQNIDEAIKWLTLSSNQGIEISAKTLIAIYSKSGNRKEAFNVCEKYANNNKGWAQSFLSNCYYQGHGCDQNDKLAFTWAKKAADNEFLDAYYLLASFYLEGIGIKQDKEMAFYYMKKAADNEFPLAYGAIGKMYYNGQGVERDEQEAFRWFKMGAQMGYPSSQFYLALCYLEGKGTSTDYQKALKWATEAINQNFEYAYAILADIYISDFYYNPELALYNINQGIEKITSNNIKYTRTDDVNKILCEFLDIKGKIYLKEKDYNSAKDMAQEILMINPKYKNENDDSLMDFYYGRNLEETIIAEVKDCASSDVDINIPQNVTGNNENTFVLIVANENYSRVPNVPHAINDGSIFKQYIISTFGIPEDNIEYLEDASLNDIKYALNKISLKCDAFKDQMSVIVYYAGHGVPDDKTNEAYLLPVDGFGTDPKSGLNMEDFYESLSEMAAKSVIVLLDACFSGAKRDGGMLMATRGITIKPNMKVPDGKLIVLSATAEDQTAFPIEDQKHGLFTYTLLRKIQETNGDITWGELADYVTETVKTRSIDLAGKLQSPTVSVSPSIKDSWRNLKIR